MRICAPVHIALSSSKQTNDSLLSVGNFYLGRSTPNKVVLCDRILLLNNKIVFISISTLDKKKTDLPNGDLSFFGILQRFFRVRQPQKVVRGHAECLRHAFEHVVAGFGFALQPFAHLTLMNIQFQCKCGLSQVVAQQKFLQNIFEFRVHSEII